MRVLITGITGMVGSHLCDFLLENTNDDIHGLIRWRSPLDNLEESATEIGRRVKLHFGDLRDGQSLRKVIREVEPDLVFHLAAQSFPMTSFTEAESTLDTNIIGTSRLLEAIREFSPNAWVHVCSSSEVFGRVSPDKLPIDEQCTFHPASPYAISKVGTDLLSRYYWEAFGLKTMTTRMFSHTGPRRGDIFAESTFAKQIAMAEAGLIPPVIDVGNLNSLRTITHVRDAVRAYYLMLYRYPIAGEVFNIGGTESYTIGEILEKLISMSSINLSYRVDPKRLRPIDADLQVPNAEKFSRLTGWTPEISVEQTLSELLAYWRTRVARGAIVMNR